MSKGKRILHRLMHVEDQQDRILAALGAVLQALEKLMALADDLKAQVADLNTATNANAASLDAVQANIVQLADRIKNSMTDQEVTDLKAALSTLGATVGAESGRLKELAKDPTVPVPPEPPALTKARAAVGKLKP